MLRAGAPYPLVTINTGGPALRRYGTDAQKRRYFPWVLEGEKPAIAITEPNAGSAATDLETRAEETPAGYRLAQRAVALADRLHLPVLTLVDTPGAHPGPRSEAEGIAGEIARTFAALDGLSTPSVCLCVGEGGSGGALALGHTDRLLLLEHAVFSVIAPEGAAAILERDIERAPDVAENLRLTSRDLLGLGMLTKSALFVFYPIALLAYALRDQGGRRRAIQGALVALGVSLLIAGAWYARNVTLYGSPFALEVGFGPPEPGRWSLFAQAHAAAITIRTLAVSPGSSLSSGLSTAMTTL